MSYCVLADVSAHNVARTVYSASTKPTDTQVQSFIDQIAGQIDAALAATHILTPCTGPAGFVAFLKLANSIGAAALAEAAQFPEFNPASPGNTPQSARYWKMFQGFIAGIIDNSLVDPGAAVSGNDPLAQTYLTDNPGWPTDDDGMTDGQQPVFSMSPFVRQF